MSIFIIEFVIKFIYIYIFCTKKKKKFQNNFFFLILVSHKFF
jgi:hypothetical protein